MGVVAVVCADSKTGAFADNKTAQNAAVLFRR
jgi:hypothetical protein